MKYLLLLLFVCLCGCGGRGLTDEERSMIGKDFYLQGVSYNIVDCYSSAWENEPWCRICLSGPLRTCTMINADVLLTHVKYSNPKACP